MDYNLAKQLKDAGFPIIEHSNKAPEHVDRGYFGMPDNKIYAPTLSELIESCGDRFGYLSKGFQHPKWYAGTDKNKTSDMLIEGIGSTPEEAVAKLWLELNSK